MKIRFNVSHSLIFFVGLLSLMLLFFQKAEAQPGNYPNTYNIVWNEQSKNASESMPCGGGSIGANVWVEKGDLLIYLSQSGAFDENNSMLKAGRLRVSLQPTPFAGSTFRQELKLQDGSISITGSNGKLSATINIWVNVFNPIVHVDVQCNQPVQATAAYESWRAADRLLGGRENNANSWKWVKDVNVITRKDSIGFKENAVLFYHQNTDSTIFDFTVTQQGLNVVKQRLFNPLKQRISGGLLTGSGMQPGRISEGMYNGIAYKSWPLVSRKPTKNHSITTTLFTLQSPTVNAWVNALHLINTDGRNTWQATKDWWQQFWQRSFIQIGNNNSNDTSLAWQAGRNYQLFRYMLGCNRNGSYPTKFNGGLFTVDPTYTNPDFQGTPDFCNWGGGGHTAQNQRLVYWPMLKSGDADLMKPQFDFYKNLLHNAELRSQTYWNHSGASFTEQMENYGLPNPAEYSYSRPADFDKGVEYNAWLEYEWDTALEFCQMILQSAQYAGTDITSYLSLIESCLQFFDEHYQYLARQRGSKALDGTGHLVLYPGSGGETYKMAYNATSTIAALQTVTKTLLQSGYLDSTKQTYFTNLLHRIPPINFAYSNNYTTIAPALHWERINNTEPMQLYPVFPWGIFGVGKPGLDTAINTYRYDTLALKFRSHVGWKQDNIFAARLGLTDEAVRLNFLKLANSGRRFPAFWGPGFDWVPDHNWGGSGMIGLQEMLLQTDDKKIMLFPAWPKNLDVHFKLHAPYQTTVEAILQNGELKMLEVLPKERAKDVVNMLAKP